MPQILKRNGMFFLLAALVVLFWYPVIFNNSFFFDDWGFIRVFQAGKADLNYFLAPHNEHFMPMFKGIFFLMYNTFGLNITPYIWLLILVHIINVGLFFYLCRLIFHHAKWLPLILAVFFLSNSSYYEVIHWFILLCTAGSLLFLQMALVFLHLYEKYNRNGYFWLSVISSFFIPMNFLQGIVGIIFIILYYYIVLEKTLSFKNIGKRDYKVLGPYIVAWIIFVLIYGIYAYNPAFQNKLSIITQNILIILQNTIFGFLGFITKSLGMGILMHPINIWVSGFLMFNLISLLFFLILYFLLNPKADRNKIIHERGIALYSFLGALISYLTIAAGRTDLESGVFLNWGRYQFYSTFFLTIFIGTMIPALIRLFSKVYDKRRFKSYLLILFILYLIGQFVIIRQKAYSTVRLEGFNFDQNIAVAASRNTSKDTLAAIWQV